MTSTVYTYDFNGPDTADGSGFDAPVGQPGWQYVSGVWRRLSNKPYTSTAPTSRPIAVVRAGIGDVDITADVAGVGGDALYVRVSDAKSWVCARIDSYITSSSTPYTYTTTVYHWHREWRDDFGNAVFAFGDSDSATSPPYMPTPNPTYTNPQYAVMLYSDSVQKSGYNTTYSTVHQVVLEYSVTGNLTTLGSVSTPTASKLRLRAIGPSISVYVNGSSSPSITKSTSLNLRVAKHGIGRGPSSQGGSSGLDNMILDPIDNVSLYVPRLML